MTRADYDRGGEESEMPAGADLGAPADLAGLRATSDDPARWEALARRIERSAAPELARRRAAALQPTGVLSFIARARRPALLAAAAAAAIVAATARLAPPVGVESEVALAESTTEAPFVAGGLQVDEPVANWLVGERSPSTTDLAREIGLEARVR